MKRKEVENNDDLKEVPDLIEKKANPKDLIEKRHILKIQ